MQETEGDGGRREGNRRERLLAIHEAAAALVEASEPAVVTIDAIAERAGVSRRTFFNYYASKEDAILGFRPLDIPEDAAAKIEGDDLTRAAHLLLAVVRTGRLTGSAQIERRRALLERFPELVQRQRQHSHDAQELVLEALAARASDEGEDQLIRRRILVLAAGMAVRFAIEHDTHLLDELTDTDLEDAVSRIRTILKDL